ncbi:MAG: flagellar hook-length control protein FliK [Calditrichaeota bacterium]|nr:MAG: flagellar hook-length control protein FliK [Calditrichota bacterium]
MNASLQTLAIPSGGADKLPFTPGKVGGLGLGTATFQDILTDAHQRLRLLGVNATRPEAAKMVKASALQLLPLDLEAGAKPQLAIPEKISRLLPQMQDVLTLGKTPDPVEEQHQAVKLRAGIPPKKGQKIQRIHLAAAQAGLDVGLLDAIIGKLLTHAGKTQRPIRVVLRHQSLGKIELHLAGGKQGVRVSVLAHAPDLVEKTQDVDRGFGSRSATKKISSVRLSAGGKTGRITRSASENKAGSGEDVVQQLGLGARPSEPGELPESGLLRTGLSLHAARKLVGDLVQRALGSKPVPGPVKLEVAVEGREEAVVTLGEKTAGSDGQSTILVEASSPRAVKWMAKQLRDAGIRQHANVKIKFVVDKQVGNTPQEAVHTELNDLVGKGTGAKVMLDSLAPSEAEPKSQVLSEPAPASASVGDLMRGLMDRVTREPVFAPIRENVRHQLKRLEADLKQALASGREVHGEIRVANERQQAQLKAHLRPVLARLLDAGVPVKQVKIAVAPHAPEPPQMSEQAKSPGSAPVSFPVAEEVAERSGKKSPFPNSGEAKVTRHTAARKSPKKVQSSSQGSAPHEARPSFAGRPAPVTNVARPQTVDLLQRIAEVARVQAQNTGGKLEIQMDVNHLGRVFVDASRKLHQIELQIQVHTHEVKRLLESQLRPLLSHMRQEGLNIGRVEVSVRDQRQDGLNQRFVSQNQNRFSERFEGFSNPQHRRDPRGRHSRPFGYDELLNRTFEFWA